MFKKGVVSFLYTFVILAAGAQPAAIQRPKLVVGLVVDQMRWDYLYRYYDRYGKGGFKRLLNEGFSCENTFIPYAQTVTAAGHATVYTGSYPSIHGIMGNEWYEKALGKSVYCTADAAVQTVGSPTASASQSPRNLWTTTICDELRLATNFRSKVIGVAIKDRGAILPAGHMANAAYWYDSGSGNWVTSTFYMDQLAGWVTDFNNRKIVDSFYRLNWNTLYPIAGYSQSEQDDSPFEGKFRHETKPVFPHELASQIGKNYGLIAATPHGNSLTLSFAKMAIEKESMGKDGVTDFLAVSLSSPDYIGHQFGPNSIEQEDDFLRLDRDLASFLSYLDAKVGKGQYLFFLTADHAVAHNPAYMESKKFGLKSFVQSRERVAAAVLETFKVPNIFVDADNYQLYLNDRAIDSAGANKSDVKKLIIKMLNDLPEVLLAFDNEKIIEANLPAELRELYLNGFNAKRAGDVQVVLKPGNFYGYITGTTHGSPFPYDSHIPLVWMGWGVKSGKSNGQHYMTDIAPTIAALLRIQMPSGCVGRPITELMK